VPNKIAAANGDGLRDMALLARGLMSSDKRRFSRTVPQRVRQAETVSHLVAAQR
jgi:hypothetical protein